MALPDPNLGIPAAFDSAGFRNAIKFSMQMGASPDADRRPKFIKKSVAPAEYFKNGAPLPAPPRMDRDGNPLDPEITVVEAADIVIEVDCAVEIDRADADEIPVGNFRPTKAIVTLLDDDYRQVEGCRELVYNGDRYMFGYEPETNGLFDVGVFTMIFYALGES